MLKYKLIILAVLILMVFIGCSRQEFTLGIRYERIEGLKVDDQILFDGNIIGSVKTISYTPQGDYLVECKVDSAYINAITEFSRFYVEDNPQLKAQKAIVVEVPRSGGNLIASGSVVQGSKRKSVLEDLAQQFGWTAKDMQKIIEEKIEELRADLGGTADEIKSGIKQTVDLLAQQLNQLNEDLKNIPTDEQLADLGRSFEQAIDQLSKQLNQLSEDFSKIPTEEYLKELERSLDQLAKELEQSGIIVREKIQQELLPELQKQLNRLRERLQQENPEQRQDKQDGIKKL